jgi:hypothetical protein
VPKGMCLKTGGETLLVSWCAIETMKPSSSTATMMLTATITTRPTYDRKKTCGGRGQGSGFEFSVIHTCTWCFGISVVDICTWLCVFVSCCVCVCVCLYTHDPWVVPLE